MSDSIISKIDEMGSRIDDLEKSIGELVKEAGVDSPPSPSTSSQGQLPPK
jgi:heat shock factor-binding protein 1